MIDVSQRLQLIAGNLEAYRDTGGNITVDEVRWLHDNLLQLADVAREQAAEHARTAEFVDAWAVPRDRPQGFRPQVIEGGRAQQ